MCVPARFSWLLFFFGVDTGFILLPPLLQTVGFFDYLFTLDSKWRSFAAVARRTNRLISRRFSLTRPSPLDHYSSATLPLNTTPSQLARLAFLPVKEAREVLSQLSSAGLIEPQEIPRSADRAPSRTIYLWFVDFNKVVTSLIHHHYKALANLQAQRQHQLELRRGLVDKRERSDVRADPTLLSARDREMIVELDKVLEALSVACLRVDEQLFVLREFDPEPEVV